MQAKCNGEQSCDWNKESLSLIDPCPATFKYMSIDYRCEEPQKPEPEVAMAPIGMSLEFNAPEKTGKNCQDILAKDLSLKKLTWNIYDRITQFEFYFQKIYFNPIQAISKARIVNSLDLIANEKVSLFKGWFGDLSRQENGRQRRDIFPKNYQRLEKFLTEDECQCKSAEVNKAYRNILNAKGNAWENFQVHLIKKFNKNMRDSTVEL